MTTLTESQLKAALTNEQIVAARTKGLGADETINPVAEEIATAKAKVDTYAAGYMPNEYLLTGWARDIAAWHVAKRLDTPTDAQTKAKERAEKELEELRDGKFPGVERDPWAAKALGKVASGGRAKVL